MTVAGVLLAATLAVAPASPPASSPTHEALPPILFVSRRPIAGHPLDAIPGLGPRHRAVVTGGRLMVRRPDGTVRPFLRGARLHDVSDPSVSYDGRRVAFAAVTHRDSAWRIWLADADGRNARPLTGRRRAIDLSPLGEDAASRFARVDDLDPCWLPDGRVCFASTRFPMEAQAGGPATNLFVVNDRGSALMRITLERNGAEEPTVDPRSGRIVYARWWTNRYLASDADSTGVTLDRALALPAERVDLWQPVSILPDGDGIRLAGGNPRVREETMAYQPCVLTDGTLVGVTADSLSLDPAAGAVRLIAYPRGFAEPLPATPEPPTCAPAALPDGRLVVSRATGRDYGLWVVRLGVPGGTRLVDAPGTHELDATVLASRPLPPVLGPGMGGLPRELPVTTREELDDQRVMVRFDCLNVFANAPVDAPIPDAPPVARDLRIRFFAAMVRPGEAGGDRVVHVRDGAVTRSGAVHEDVTPADVPMFEQLIDAHGHVLRTTRGPTHVAGFNSGRFMSGTKCVGCHVGHSVIAVADNYATGKRFNVSTSATVTASSAAAGSSARAAVDRRTRGDVAQVAWIAASSGDERLTLTFPFALAIDSLRIHGIRPDPAAGTDLTLAGCEVTLRRGTRVVRRLSLSGDAGPDGAGLECGGIAADVVEVRPRHRSGRVLGREAVGLAEIETRARIIEE